MARGISRDISRHPAGRWLRSGCRPVGAGFLVSFLVFSFSYAAAPLDCIVGASGRRICLNDVKPASSVVSYSTYSNEPHPATVRGPYRAYAPLGQVVNSIPIEHFLPGYFVLRKSALGIGVSEKQGASDESAP